MINIDEEFEAKFLLTNGETLETYIDRIIEEKINAALVFHDFSDQFNRHIHNAPGSPPDIPILSPI